jgi:hypothetical protein
MQKVPGDKSTAFFIVTKEDHPKFKSTLPERSLKRLGLKIPEYQKHIPGSCKDLTMARLIKRLKEYYELIIRTVKVWYLKNK